MTQIHYHNQKPALLSALCMLTFLGSTIGFLGYFAAALFFNQASELIIRLTSWHSAEAVSPLYFNLLMVLYALSFTGAVRMWKRHIDGLFFYAISQTMIIFLPAIWIGWQAFSVSNAIFTTVFLIGYAWNIPWLRRSI